MVDEPDDDLDTRLQQVGQQVRRWRELERAAAAARGKLTELTAREQGHRQRAERAARELAHARSFWPSALLARLTGNGRQIALAAEHVIASARNAIDGLEPQVTAAQADVDRGEAARRTFAGVAEAYTELLRCKDELVRAAGGELAARAAAATATVQRLQQTARSVRYLLENVRQAEHALGQARDVLVALGHHGRVLVGDVDQPRHASHVTFGVAQDALARARVHLQRVADEAAIDRDGLGRLELASGEHLAAAFRDPAFAELLSSVSLANTGDIGALLLPRVAALASDLERHVVSLENGLAAAEDERADWLESVRV
jgi:hypothetical protein